MFIEPNAEIQLFMEMSLDREHRHTIYFQSRAAQEDYFSNYEHFTLGRYTYIREEKCISAGLDRTLGFGYTEVSQCNYLRFKNTAFYNKWFYAFIDKIEYGNQNCAKIFFTIDPMQTWLADVDYQLGDCFVERCHTETDQIGDNLVEEDLETGEYIWGPELTMQYLEGVGQYHDFDFEDCSLVMATNAYFPSLDAYISGDVDWVAFLASFAFTIPAEYWGSKNVSGLHFYVFPNNREGMVKYATVMRGLQELGKVDEVFSIFWFPNYFIEKDVQSNGRDALSGNLLAPGFIPASVQLWSGQFDRKATTTGYLPSFFGKTNNVNYKNIDGYVPKNNKLYTYPYNFLCVLTPSGSKIFKYEMFEHGVDDNYTSGGECRFKVMGALTPTGTIQIVPEGYLQDAVVPRTGEYRSNYSDVIEVSGFPQACYNTDLEKAYIAQWRAGFGARLIGGAANFLTRGIGNQVLGGAGFVRRYRGYRNVTGTVGALVDDIAGMHSHAAALGVAPSKTEGTASDVTTIQNDFLAPLFFPRHVRAEYAKIIDDFFTVFGYACKRCTIPNLHARENFTYVKTRGCYLLGGNFPHDFESQISEIFDNGITFWVDGDAIGNYSISNRPLSEVNT